MLKKLKSLFIKEEEISTDKEETKKPDNPVSKEAAESPSSSNQKDSKPVNIPVSDGKPSKKFVDILLNAMNKENLDGVDYLEFKQSLKSLDGVIEEEETKFKSAFAMGKTMGLSKDKLLKSGQHYMDVLEKEKQKFQVTYDKRKAEQIQHKEEGITKLTKGIEARKKQILALQKEIEKYEAALAKEKSSINVSHGKLVATKGAFDASYDYIVSKIKTDFENIKKYI